MIGTSVMNELIFKVSWLIIKKEFEIVLEAEEFITGVL